MPAGIALRPDGADRPDQRRGGAGGRRGGDHEGLSERLCGDGSSGAPGGRRGSSTLIVAGFMTHMCVNSTARSAFSLGFRPTVVASATATRDLPAPDGSVMPAEGGAGGEPRGARRSLRGDRPRSGRDPRPEGCMTAPSGPRCSGTRRRLMRFGSSKEPNHAHQQRRGPCRRDLAAGRRRADLRGRRRQPQRASRRRSAARGKIEWVHVRHEEAGAFAAGAEAQLTGRLAVCAGSCGPGNVHLINGLYDCHRTRTPVLAIAAHIPSAGDRHAATSRRPTRSTCSASAAITASWSPTPPSSPTCWRTRCGPPSASRASPW